MAKLIDCITFFDNNFIFDFRYNVIKNCVDKFIVCESLFDHKNNPKKINFDLEKKYKNNSQIIHLILKRPFPKKTNAWQNQSIQREYILENLNFTDENDLIFFSDPDEIPNPNLLSNFILTKKYGIFLQKIYNYKFNLFNPYENPWEGTRVCKKKNLKSIDFMREKIKAKNLRYKFYRLDKEKSIEIFDNGGWHFNNLMQPELISKKLKTFAHSEFSGDQFSSIETIKKKIEEKVDLFNRGHKYSFVKIDNTFPKYLINNLKKYKDYILD
tara:strand:- start:4547 stop:5356 length:810 start_codon:yes stop_codon:yes gene_type:complete